MAKRVAKATGEGGADERGNGGGGGEVEVGMGREGERA